MYRIFTSVIFIIFIILRIIALLNVNVLEDHDSIHYLMLISNLVDADFNTLFSYNPDNTYLFPFLGIIFYPFTRSIEMSARFVSLSSSILLFFSIFALSIRLTNKKNSLVIIFLLAIHPLLINHSISVMTEPLYISIIYFGFYIFLRFIDKPSYNLVFVLSIVFALGFLNRTEGIVFLVFIPAMLILLKYLDYLPKLNWLTIFKSIILYVFLFCVFISPQIIRVSNELGGIALNGRQVWQLVMHENDGRSYDEKIRGLDYSSKEVNLTYLMKHPEERAKYQESSSIYNYSTNTIIQLKDFFRHKIFVLFGKIEILLIIIGIFVLFLKKHRFLMLLINPMLIIVFIPPLLHDVDIRHILIIVPLLIFLISFAIFTLSNILSYTVKNYLPTVPFKNIKIFTVYLILGVLIIFKFPLVKETIITPFKNNEYSKSEILSAADVLSSFGEKGKSHKIVSKKTYLPFYAKATYIPFPYAPYNKLVEYCKQNNADYLFMDYRNMKKYEILPKFLKNDVPEFELIYSSKGDFDKKIEIYKFK